MESELRGSKPFSVFENRLSEIFQLKGLIDLLEIPKNIKYQSRKQFIVSLVTCFETYLKDMYKLMIDKKIIKLEKLYRVKRIKDAKYKILELLQIEKREIRISTLICNEINFQNFDQLVQAYSVIDLEKNFESILKKFKSGSLKKSTKYIDKALNKVIVIKRISKKFAPKFKNERYNLGSKLRAAHIALMSIKEVLLTKNLKGIQEKKKIYGIIKLLLTIRHNIVHRDINYKIKNLELHGFVMAVFLFCSVVEDIYRTLELKESIINPKKQRDYGN